MEANKDGSLVIKAKYGIGTDVYYEVLDTKDNTIEMVNKATLGFLKESNEDIKKGDYKKLLIESEQIDYFQDVDNYISFVFKTNDILSIDRFLAELLRQKGVSVSYAKESLHILQKYMDNYRFSDFAEVETLKLKFSHLRAAIQESKKSNNKSAMTKLVGAITLDFFGYLLYLTLMDKNVGMITLKENRNQKLLKVLGPNDIKFVKQYVTFARQLLSNKDVFPFFERVETLNVFDK